MSSIQNFCNFKRQFLMENRGAGGRWPIKFKYQFFAFKGQRSFLETPFQSTPVNGTASTFSGSHCDRRHFIHILEGLTWSPSFRKRKPIKLELLKLISIVWLISGKQNQTIPRICVSKKKNQVMIKPSLLVQTRPSV